MKKNNEAIDELGKMLMIPNPTRSSRTFAKYESAHVESISDTNQRMESYGKMVFLTEEAEQHFREMPEAMQNAIAARLADALND